jgi:hypothetical protein
MSKVITPTVGRIVWFRPKRTDNIFRDGLSADQPFSAMIIYVHSDRKVNLDVVGHTGFHWMRPETLLIQPGDDRPQVGDINFCEWMPYQVGHYSMGFL